MPVPRCGASTGRRWGRPPLVEAVSDFADGWKHGITKIGEYTEGTGQALTQVARIFDECDTALGQACRPDGGAGGQA